MASTLQLVRHPLSRGAVRGIAVKLERSAATLKVRYELDADLATLRLPVTGPVRRGEKLWQHTCFEVFLSDSMPAYTEFNFSPSGEWASYGFRRYREGAPLPHIASLQRLEISHAQPGLVIDATLHQLGAGGLAVGLSAVVEDSDGSLSYWALRHPPGNPDFHHPDAFALRLHAIRD